MDSETKYIENNKYAQKWISNEEFWGNIIGSNIDTMVESTNYTREELEAITRENPDKYKKGDIVAVKHADYLLYLGNNKWVTQEEDEKYLDAKIKSNKYTRAELESILRENPNRWKEGDVVAEKDGDYLLYLGNNKWYRALLFILGP